MNLTDIRLEVIIDTINRLGGEATYKDIYSEIMKDKRYEIDRFANNRNFESSVRELIQIHSSDSYSRKPDSLEQDIFYSVEGIGSGVWGLREEYRNKIDYIKEIKGEYYSEREKEDMVKIRVGQGKFRDRLFERDKKCMLCGVDIKEHLIASHIKPWKDSNDIEKLDVDNGLLLCPNHDSLFDKGYISFDSEGKILISDSLNKNNRVFLNINEEMTLDLNNVNKKNYMVYHRKYVFENFK